MFNTRRHLAVLFSSIFILTACGGGGGSSAESSSASFNNNVQSTALADCFTLTAGTKFTLNNGYKMQVVQESFNGQISYGRRELRSDESIFGTNYWNVDNLNINILGYLDDTGSKRIYTNYLIPTKLTTGQSVSVDAAEMHIDTSTPPNVTSSTFTDVFTFIGFENLNLGGKSFVNTCKISITENNGQTDVMWFAKGFGWIRAVTLDNQGNEILSTIRQLTSITSAP